MRRALVVDDRPENLDLLRALLAGHGWEVVAAGNGEEALALARQSPPDIAITDLLMPGMDGFTLLRHWKADPVLRSVPLVVYTATYTDPQDEQLALDLGADAFVLKPAEPDAFLARIDEVCARAARGEPPAAAPAITEEPVVLREYSEALVRRLEAKSRQLELANRELREREARLRAILDTEPECVKLLDADGRFLEVNAAGLRMLGASCPGDVAGQSFLRLVVEEDRAAVRDLVAGVFRGECGTIEYRCNAPTGGRLWVETHAAPLRGAAGEVTSLLGISRDITERRKSEARLAHLSRLYTILGLVNRATVRARTREDLFQAICRAAVAHGGMALAWVGLLDRATASVVAAAAHGAGAEAAAALRLDLNDAQVKVGLMSRALSTGRLALSRDIESDPALLHMRPLTVAHGLHAATTVPFRVRGEIAGFLILVSAEVDYFADAELQDLVGEMAADVSFALDVMDAAAQRRQAERALKDLAHAVEAAGDVVFLTDPRGVITQINERFTALYGYTADEVVGKATPRILGSGKETRESNDTLWATLRRGESVRRECANRAKDGRLLEIEQAITPFRDDQGRLAGFLSVQREIGARKRAEAEARLLQAIAVGVATAEDLDDALAFVLRQVCETTGWAMGEAWLPEGEPARLACHGAWHAPAPGLEAFQRVSQELRLAPGEGLPGRVWRTRHPEWLSELGDPRRFLRFEAAAAAGFGAGLGVPVLAHGEVVLVLDFFLLAPSDEDARRVELIAAVGAQIGALIERKRVEEALAASERRYHVISSAASDYMFSSLVQPDGRLKVEWVAGAFERITGFTLEEYAAAGGWRALLHPDDLAQDDRDLEQLRRGERVVTEVRTRNRQGGFSWARVFARPVLDPADGRLVGIHGAVQDVTARREAEDRVAASEAHFRTLIEHASDLVTVIDTRGVIRFQGPSVERLLGYRPEEMAGRTAFDYLHPEDAPRALAAVRRVLAEPEGTAAVEYRCRHRDGSWRTLESIGRSLLDPDGEMVVVVNSRDVTASRQLEEQVRQAQKMDAIGHLAGGVAHDFNNVLAIVMMQAGLIAEEDGLPVAARTGLLEIRAAAERGAALTRQLLLFGRRQVLQPRELDVNELVSDLVRMLRRILGEDVHLELDLHPAPLWTRADAGMLDQVVTNLVVNARDAMPGGGRLRIATATHFVGVDDDRRHPEAVPGHYLRLEVGDTGCGIAPEVLPRIFEPFFTTKETGRGTGLGLATSFSIVKQHRGWIEVRSEPGRGSDFHVFLPALAAAQAGDARTAARPRPRGGTETILLVEDEPAVRVLARTVLERAGYQVIEAASGTEALQLWSTTPGRPALLLTDLVMPGGLGGRQLAARLRTEHGDLKVVFMSGYSAEIAGRELDLPAGANFLQKPFSYDLLLTTVRRCLDG